MRRMSSRSGKFMNLSFSAVIAAGLLSILMACDYVPSEDLVAAKALQSVEEWETEADQWRARRLAALLRDDGWLTLIGLEWIETGSNRVGSSPKNEVVIRSASVPKWLGVIVVEQMPRLSGGEQVHAKARFVPNASGTVFLDGEPVDEPLVMHTDAEEDTTILTSGTTQFHLIERGDRLGVRIKDSKAAALLDFAGLEYYPFDPDWRIEGRFIPHDKTMRIGDVTGFVQEIPSPGTIEFQIDDQVHRLIALEGGEDSYFIIFSDTTNGTETYGAGRYLYTGREDAEGRIVVDFNQSYSPPCVFTDFATCPLPPAQNRLSFPVRAGEKMYVAGHDYAGPRE